MLVFHFPPMKSCSVVISELSLLSFDLPNVLLLHVFHQWEHNILRMLVQGLRNLLRSDS